MSFDTLNILITSAGTASAISVIKALKKQKEYKLRLIAVDVDPLAPGLYLADAHYLVPSANSDNYISTLLEISDRENITILIPIHSKEIELIAENASLLLDKNVKTLIPSAETIRNCNNKKEMNRIAGRHGIAVIKTYDFTGLKNLDTVKLPVFAKPNSGSSSTGTFMIKTKEELETISKSGVRDLLIQEFIEAEEVTVDVFCNKNCVPIVVAPRLRLSTKSGQSVKGKTIQNGPYIDIVNKLCQVLKLRGACNIQFFTKGHQIIFSEINPRFAAGGLMLTMAAGVNIPLLLLKEILAVPIKPKECKTTPGVYMTRYWEEVFLSESDLINENSKI